MDTLPWQNQLSHLFVIPAFYQLTFRKYDIYVDIVNCFTLVFYLIHKKKECQQEFQIVSFTLVSTSLYNFLINIIQKSTQHTTSLQKSCSSVREIHLNFNTKIFYYYFCYILFICLFIISFFFEVFETNNSSQFDTITTSSTSDDLPLTPWTLNFQLYSLLWYMKMLASKISNCDFNTNWFINI